MRRNLLIINLLAPFFLLAQNAENEKPSLFELRKSLQPRPHFPIFENQNDASFLFKNEAPKIIFSEKPTSLVCTKFSPDDLAFFCRIEHRMAKKSPTKVKFRLGSVEHVDFLEGKN